jgi:hypothetical protein
MLLIGCNENSNDSTINHDSISDKIELIDHIYEYNNGHGELRGQIKNIGDEDIDLVNITVYFYNRQNELEYTGIYQLYNFQVGLTENFVVDILTDDPFFVDYNNYEIKFIIP